jgi:hypothetical protein
MVITSSPLTSKDGFPVAAGIPLLISFERMVDYSKDLIADAFRFPSEPRP